MAKSKSGITRIGTNNNNSSSNANGGIMGSGIFGMTVTQTKIQCIATS